jgi:geranylgeranyl pyrophosphate synthase
MLAASHSQKDIATILQPGSTWLRNFAVEEKLQIVEAELAHALQSTDSFVSEVCTYLFQAGGKRLRPALVLLSARFGNPDNTDTIWAAAAVELLHLATLYHDDIIDESSSRRGTLSVNSKWNNRVAVAAGTYLFAKANELFAALGNKVNQAASRAVVKVWQGQMREIENLYNLDLDEETVFSIIKQKTATLYELSCYLGSLVSDASISHQRLLTAYGRNLGIAFQLVDDVLDLMADAALLGKPPGTDLQEGVYTLPILHSLKSQGPEAEKLRGILSRRGITPDGMAAALEIISHNGALQYTVNRARDFAGQAKSCLQSLPAGSDTESLHLLADLVINRAELI